jgi:hypothetical protein
MSFPVRHSVLLALAVLASAWDGCALTPPVEPTHVQMALVGMSKDELIQCVGAPLSETSSGEETVLLYHETTAPIEQYFSARGGVSHLPRSCKVRVVLKAGRVAAVEYSPASEDRDARKECDDMFADCHFR